MSTSVPQVIIIGAGLSGLSCARTLQAHGVDFTLVESTKRVGGRLGSDIIDGVTCDRGFQVSMSNYRSLERLVPRSSLPRHGFTRGAILVSGSRRVRVVDPKSDPIGAVRLLFSGIGGWRDLRAANRCRALAARVGCGESVEGTARTLIDSVGFTTRFFEEFLKPFFCGVLLDENLEVPAERFLLTLDRFAHGRAELPAGGMQQIAEVMAQPIRSAISFERTVAAAGEGWVEFADGARMTCDHVVLAVPYDALAALIGHDDIPDPSDAWSATGAVHFATSDMIPSEPIIHLNAGAQGRLNLACVPSAVAEGYAPKGTQSIIASLRPWRGEEQAPVISDAVLHDIQMEAGSLLGVDSSSWRHLRTHLIPRALPGQRRPSPFPGKSSRLHATGDWLRWPSIEASVEDGVGVGESIVRQLACGV